VAMMARTAAGAWAEPAVIGGALLDLAIGAGILFRRSAKPALLAAFTVSLLYLALGTWLEPTLWLDPLGPLMKIVPILVLNLLCLALLDER
ncbi:MAG: DoxX-like family protein, partial [Allosphingosinicella sp.]